MTPKDIQKLRERFPLSESTIRRNSAGDRASGAKPEPPVCNAPNAAIEGEKENAGRVSVSVRSFRSRLIDPDNLCPKYFIDCLRYAGIISDDSSKHIRLSVEQFQCGKGSERTEIEIE